MNPFDNTVYPNKSGNSEVLKAVRRLDHTLCKYSNAAQTLAAQNFSKLSGDTHA